MIAHGFDGNHWTLNPKPCRFRLQGDLQSLEDLTYERRRAFLARNPLPADVPVISFHTEANRAARAVSIMSHVAHAQLPWLPGSGRTPQPVAEDNCDYDAEGRRLHVAVPLAAAMAMCALHLELRWWIDSNSTCAYRRHNILHNNIKQCASVLFYGPWKYNHGIPWLYSQGPPNRRTSLDNVMM